jgi:hypothetical protein
MAQRSSLRGRAEQRSVWIVQPDLDAILFGGETSSPIEVKPEPVSAASLGEFAGSYKTPEIPLSQNLVVQDGQLFMQWGSYASPHIS